jgi:hypothetical protein
MFCLFKIGVGVVTGALLLGLATPAWGATADRQRTKRPALCPLDYAFPVQEARAQGRRVNQPAGGQLGSVLQFLGIDPSQARVREMTSSRLNSFASAVAEQTRGKVQSVYSDKNELVLRDNTGVNWKFLVPKDAKVFINAKQAKLSDLQNGDQAVVTHEMRGLLPMVASEIRCTR